MGVCREGQNGNSPPLKIGAKKQNFVENMKPEAYFRCIDLNSCIDSLFGGMTLSLHKIQVHYTGVMHAVMSLQFTNVRSFSCGGRLRNWQAEFLSLVFIA